MEALAVSREGKSSQKLVLKNVKLKAQTKKKAEIPLNDIFFLISATLAHSSLNFNCTDNHKLH